MKSRTRNSALGMVSSALYYILYILLGIVNRKALVSIMGIEYQGANGLFSSVLNVLSIAELGIGTAIIYHLYKPVAQDDRSKIKVIMAFYKKCFNCIALFMLVVGGLLAIRIDFFVGDNSLPINLRVVYFLMLADVVASYTFAYKRSILYANQKQYVVANINTLFVIGYNIFQIGILYIFKNFYAFLAIKVIFRIVENAVLNVIVNKSYPYLREKTKDKIPPEILYDIKLKVKGLLFHKIGTFVVNGTDNIIISKFIGLLTVGVYSNYNYIITSVNGLLQQVFDASVGSIGNLLLTENHEKCYSVFQELNLLNILITSIATAGVYSLSNDFIQLIFKDYLLQEYVLLILSVNMLLTGQRRVFGVYKNAAGIQYEDRYVPVFEAIINLGLSLVLVQRLGLAGVFIGTIVSQFCVFVYTFPIFIFKKIFGKGFCDYVRYLLRVFTYQIFAIVSIKFILNYFFHVGGVLFFLIKIIICVLYELLLFYMVWRSNEEFQHLLVRGKRIIENVINK